MYHSLKKENALIFGAFYLLRRKISKNRLISFHCLQLGLSIKNECIMKYFSYIFISLFFSFSLIAQETQVIKKDFNLPQGKKLDLDLKFASDILIDSWEKNEVSFRAIISFNEPGIEKVHTMDIDDTEDYLSIATDYDFDAHKSSNWDCNQYNRNYYNKDMYCIKVRYELTIPKNAKIKLETIAGNIEVKGFKGEMRAKSISGYVDVALAEAHQTRLKFRSVTGEIYTDFDIKLDSNSSAYAKKLTTELNGGSDQLLSLETVSGDIFFRKI